MGAAPATTPATLIVKPGQTLDQALAEEQAKSFEFFTRVAIPGYVQKKTRNGRIGLGFSTTDQMESKTTSADRVPASSQQSPVAWARDGHIHQNRFDRELHD